MRVDKSDPCPSLAAGSYLSKDRTAFMSTAGIGDGCRCSADVGSKSTHE